MKILVLSMNHEPELTGVGKYTGEMVDGLARRGHELLVVCAPPYYPRWQLSAPYDAGSYWVERPRPGVCVVRCPLWVPGRPGGLQRVAHLLSFALSSAPVTLGAAAWRPDLVMAVAPSLISAPAALLAANLCGARSWLHVQDFEIDAAFELGLLKGEFTRRRVLAHEARLMRAFDRVTTISDRMRERLLAKGLDSRRVGLQRNGVDVMAIRPAGGSPALRSRLGLRCDQVVCLYTGTMNRKHDLGTLVEAARRLVHRDDIAFVLAGEGECRPELERACAVLSNVRLLPLCPIDQLGEQLGLADVHLLPQLRGATDLVMPSKLTGMMASGRPVIAAAQPGCELASVVAGHGLLVEPESASALARAVTALADDAATRQLMGRAARAYALAELDREALLDQLDHSARTLAARPAFTAGAMADAVA
jgi:colanic acid biosynthesis glycosyl transferase WcaI